MSIYSIITLFAIIAILVVFLVGWSIKWINKSIEGNDFPGFLLGLILMTMFGVGIPILIVSVLMAL